MKRSYQVLQLLSAHPYISGTFIGEQLGISRAAIQKHITYLREQGVEIESTKGKGYNLRRPIHLLDSSYLNKNLPIEVKIVPQSGSTNTDLLTLKKPLLLACELQTHGRGRHGKSWLNVAWQNIAISLGYNMKWHQHLSALSLVVGSRLAQTLIEFGVLEVGIKWPNDILINHKKIGGILIEAAGECDGNCFVVIGIGLNFHLSKNYMHHVDQPTTCLTELGYNINRNTFIALLISRLLEDLAKFEKEGFSPFMHRWNELYAWRNKKIHVSNPTIEGIALGSDNTGALIVEDIHATRHTINSINSSTKLI